MSFTTPKAPSYICLYIHKAETPNDGDIFAYIFYDVANDKIIVNGIFKKDQDSETILEQIKRLPNYSNFKSLNKESGFTLLLHRGEDIVQEARNVLRPFKGNVVYNPDNVARMIKPLVPNIDKYLAEEFRKLAW